MTTEIEVKEIDPRITALLKHLEYPDNLTLETSDDMRYETSEGEEYLVLTDEESEEAWNESMDSYIDECILSELPEAYRYYFDSEKWKYDASFDGRRNALATYDSVEHEQGDYYIYRTN